MYIDSHCHLNHKRLSKIGTPHEIVKLAHDAGVEGMLTICCRIADEFPEILTMTKSLKGKDFKAPSHVWCTVGTHPHDAGLDAEKAITEEQLINIATSDPCIVGIGESGLDYFYKHSSVEDQQASFRKHIRACIKTDLPLVIHAREADKDVMRILKEETANAGKAPKGVLHCFSSSPEMGREALEFGFYISFSGIVTFPKSSELQQFGKEVPLDRILIETDAPFLAPEPYRGKINQPAFVTHTAEYVANIKNVDKETIASHSKQNFFSLFDKAKS